MSTDKPDLFSRHAPDDGLTRYVHVEEPLSPERAQRIRDAQISSAECEIEYLTQKLKEEQDYRAKLLRRPLDTHITVQKSLRPGDPGYDEAPVHFDATHWQGDFQWMNLPAGDSKD